MILSFPRWTLNPYSLEKTANSVYTLFTSLRNIWKYQEIGVSCFKTHRNFAVSHVLALDFCFFFFTETYSTSDHHFSFHSSFVFPSSLHMFLINLISDKKESNICPEALQLIFLGLFFYYKYLKRLESLKMSHLMSHFLWSKNIKLGLVL